MSRIRNRAQARMHKQQSRERLRRFVDHTERVCQKPDCPTVLSSYNPGPFCFTHSSPDEKAGWYYDPIRDRLKTVS